MKKNIKKEALINFNDLLEKYKFIHEDVLVAFFICTLGDNIERKSLSVDETLFTGWLREQKLRQ